MIADYFQIPQRGTTIRTEVLGGLTTFATMAYIIVVNPAILAFAGIPAGPGTVATILTAVFGSVLMGVYANRPIAVAPYMGENAFLAFGLAAMGISWQLRLGAVFVAGVLFLIMTMLRLRSWLADSLSHSMKCSFAVGIGLFLAFLGLYQSGLVTSFVTGMPVPDTEVMARPDVPIKLGDLQNAKVQLSIFGFVVTTLLLAWRIRGAILLGIAATALTGCLFGVSRLPTQLVALPFTGEYTLNAIAFQLDIAGVLRLSFLPVLLTLCLMSFLDTLGTLIGVGVAGGLLDEDGKMADIERPMLVDAVTCLFSALAGTSTSGAYIESAAGIREGARTGLAAVTTGLLFAGSLFFIPLFQSLQQLDYACAPALVVVGIMMMAAVTEVDFRDLTEAAPAFITIVMMVFTWNIGNGLTMGLILYPVLKILTGRWRELHPGSIILGVMCLLYYVCGQPH